MSAATAIGMVSESLRNLLLGEMSLIPAVNVTILAPDESGGDRRLNLFLYKVQENPALKNQDWQVKRGEPERLVPPPLSLNLFYLLTPYATNDPQTGNATAHQMLGDAMRVFYENPILPEDYLALPLQGAREQIKIMPNSLNLEELSQIWGTFTRPFRLSVPYEVSVVQLDALPKQERPMARRVRYVGVPKVTSDRLPVVEELTPLQGAAGTVLAFRGQHLAGWKAYVSLSGRLLVEGVEIDGDHFQITLPPATELAPGFYEIRVDVSHLFRRLFWFEVTP